MTTHILCTFTALDDLKQREKSDPIAVGRALARAGRFSVFEATESDRMARTMDKIGKSGWFVFDIECGYPWTEVTVTDAGRVALGLPPASGGAP